MCIKIPFPVKWKCIKNMIKENEQKEKWEIYVVKRENIKFNNNETYNDETKTITFAKRPPARPSVPTKRKQDENEHLEFYYLMF